MSDKYFHTQPCFCLPCRVLKQDKGERLPLKINNPAPEKKPKKARGAKKV